MLKKIVEHCWEDIGVDHCQTFPGRGVALTAYDAVYVGQGESSADAADDAMESAAQDDWDVDDLEAPEDMNQIIPEELDNAEGCYYYVALYLKGE